MTNPYEPPKSDPRRRGLDKFGETRNHKDELVDWSGFFFVVTIVFYLLYREEQKVYKRRGSKKEKIHSE